VKWPVPADTKGGNPLGSTKAILQTTGTNFKKQEVMWKIIQNSF